jgi:hypothetical protein
MEGGGGTSTLTSARVAKAISVSPSHSVAVLPSVTTLRSRSSGGGILSVTTQLELPSSRASRPAT